MERPATPPARRAATTAVHSLHRFCFSVPDLGPATDFYTAFGLDVRKTAGRIDLHTHGHPHRWGSVYGGHGPKRFEYLSFAADAHDHAALVAGLDRKGIARTAPHPLADEPGVWIRDPDGNAIQIVVADKTSPVAKIPAEAPSPLAPGAAAAPSRSRVGSVRPRRLSHVLLFSPDVLRQVRFYSDALGMRLSDHSGPMIAFLHGAHGSDHHMVAFAHSDGPGLHHSSWDVASLDDVGNGMQRMLDHGHTQGWGVGRHVLGSNYFYYVRDPWGSFAEYSYDIDFIPADVEWKAADHPPEDSFYVWGPPPPDYFVQNHESASRQAAA